MNKIGIKLIFTGIALIALSGLEKIALYISLSDRGIGDYQTLRAYVPDEIWKVTTNTLTLGVCIILIGIIISIKVKYWLQGFGAFKNINEFLKKLSESERNRREAESSRE